MPTLITVGPDEDPTGAQVCFRACPAVALEDLVGDADPVILRTQTSDYGGILCDLLAQQHRCDVCL